jgi:hypothetical protein
MEDAQYVAANLRDADRDEVLAACNLDPRLVLPLFIQEGREVWAAGVESNDRAEILYGVDPVECCPGAGTIWLLSTPVLYQYPVEFVVRSKELLDQFHERYELLGNYIDERNTRHIRWLKYMGFKILQRVECFGAQSRPFLEFASFRLNAS